MKSLSLFLVAMLSTVAVFAAVPKGFNWNVTDTAKITAWMGEDKDGCVGIYKNLIELSKFDKTITIDQYNKVFNKKLCPKECICYVQFIYCVNRFGHLAKDVNTATLNKKCLYYYNKYLKMLALENCTAKQFSALFKDVVKVNITDTKKLAKALSIYEARLSEFDAATIKADMKYAKLLVLPKLTNEAYKPIVVKIELILKAIE